MTLDPWRYRCVECGSCNLRYHPTAGKETFRGNAAEAKYRCNRCGAKRDKRKDMKTGKVIA